MKVQEILSPSFASVRKAACTSLVAQCRADSFDFFSPALNAGLLTAEQMASACRRYLLGRSKSGRCIFWLIDEQGHVRDGRLADTWVSQLLKAREPQLLSDWHTTHCLFGLQVLSTSNDSLPVCVVESAASAVMLSELFPDQVWLATVCPDNATVDRFTVLRGYTVSIIPHTDTTMSNYISWLELADTLRRTYHLDIHCNPILEDNATAEQKQRNIDLLDFYLESVQKASLFTSNSAPFHSE